jgi:hypothetical protein
MTTSPTGEQEFFTIGISTGVRASSLQRPHLASSRGMLSKIAMVLACAMAIITVVPASVGTSFARKPHRSAQIPLSPDGRDRAHHGTTMGGYHYKNGICYYDSGPCYRWSPQ